MDNVRRDKLLEQQANASMIHLNSGFVFPYIEKRIQETLDQMSHDLRAGKTDFVARVAYVTALQDLKSEIEHVARKGGVAINKLGSQP